MMIGRRSPSSLRVLVLAMLAVVSLQAQQHHTARRLGHPSTRFADPLQSPEDLRERLTCEQLRDDVLVVVNQCDGWRGDIEDFRAAALSAPISALQIPVGTLLPAMSSRKNGRPILQRNIVWGGTEPIDAYEFSFYSNGQEYRCVTPKLCSNFWVENVGPDRRAAVLALACNVPETVLPSRPLPVCFTLSNRGDKLAEEVTVTLPIPAGAVYAGPDAGDRPGAVRLIWRIPNLAPGTSKRLCADFIAPEPGDLAFAAAAGSSGAESVESQCTTRVKGIAAVLFEVVDVNDPIEVGQQNTYDVSVQNQGNAPLANIRLVCRLEDSQEFVEGGGASEATADGTTITFAPLATLAPQATAGWQVVVKALGGGDVRFAAEITSDEIIRPVAETEATRQY